MAQRRCPQVVGSVPPSDPGLLRTPPLPLTCQLRCVLPARLDVPALARPVPPDALPRRRTVAVSRLQLAVVHHPKAPTRLSEEGGDETAGLGHHAPRPSRVDRCRTSASNAVARSSKRGGARGGSSRYVLRGGAPASVGGDSRVTRAAAQKSRRTDVFRHRAADWFTRGAGGS